MGQYKSQHTGPQIDAGVDAALNPDVTVTPDSDALVTSGAVADALDNIDPTITGNTDTTLNGIIVGNGSKVGTKSLDTSSLTNDGDHVPVSSVVKSALNTVDESIAIRVSGNKTTYASGAAIGQYVIVDGSTIAGITDGLYKAAKAIPYNTVIDSTYLTAASGGGLNDLKSDMYYRTGDTISISESNPIATWCLILSQTSIAIAVPLDKKCIANGATVTLGTAFIRATGNASLQARSVTVTNVTINNNGTELIVEGTVSSMSGASANTIGYVGCVSGTITFT